MTVLIGQAAWVGALGYLTYGLARSVVDAQPELRPHPNLRKFHHRVMMPFGALLTFVFACLTLGAGAGFVGMLLSK